MTEWARGENMHKKTTRRSHGVTASKQDTLSDHQALLPEYITSNYSCSTKSEQTITQKTREDSEFQDQSLQFYICMNLYIHMFTKNIPLQSHKL